MTESSVKTVLDGLLDLIYPPKCLVCQTLNPLYLCESCISKIEPVPKPYCPTCGHPLRDAACHNCAGRPRSFHAARAVGSFEGVLREAVHEFKYKGARVLADPLADLLLRFLSDASRFNWRKADCIAPVPIHPIRRRLRGYNQSELLARRLGELTGLPLVNAAVRTRHTRPQVELSGDERRANVKGAFGVPDPSLVKDRTILLVDDVATTCSTIYECSLSLLSAGASRVYVVCLAFGG